MREEIQKTIAAKLKRRYARQYKSDAAWAWDSVREWLKTATPAQKKEILRAIEGVSMVTGGIQALADTEAQGMLANDSLDLNELSRILEES